MFKIQFFTTLFIIGNIAMAIIPLHTINDIVKSVLHHFSIAITIKSMSNETKIHAKKEEKKNNMKKKRKRNNARHANVLQRL